MRCPGLRRAGARAPRAAGALLGAALALPGCVAPPQYGGADSLYFQDRPREVLQSYAQAEDDGSINALLGIDKMLSAALLAGDWGLAEKYAELASSRVNIYLSGERGERDALSFLGRESSKPFKGESHERAMVDFYLGLLRYRRGDFEGALNAFLSAMNKNRGVYRLPVERRQARSDSENAETVLYSNDYSTLAFLAASCCRHIDEPEEAARHLAEAKRVRADLADLFDRGMDPRNNVLAVIETGRAPVKIKTGPRGEALGYRRAAEADLEEARIDGQLLSWGLTDDLYVQASTLGGRAVDDLNRLKASRQEALHTAGFATAVAGGVLAAAASHSRGRHSRELEAAGLIAMGVGIATAIFSEAAVDPSADVRAWTTLPDRIYLAVGSAPPGEHEVEIRGRNRYGGDESQRWKGVPVVAGRPTLLWFRLLPSRRGGVYAREGAAPQVAAPPLKETNPGKES